MRGVRRRRTTKQSDMDVIPAKAGIQLDPRLRGGDKNDEIASALFGISPRNDTCENMTQAPTKHHPNYMAVFWVLLIFTLLEVGVTYLPVPRFPMAIILVGLAMTKALLVAMYYMHLKFEKKLLVLIAVSPLLTAIILTAALIPDIGMGR